MKLGVCALCKQKRNLEESHIIPNAAFKTIKKPMSGKTISISSDENERTRYTTDSWWEYLLCSDCEDIIEKYETYFFQ